MRRKVKCNHLLLSNWKSVPTTQRNLRTKAKFVPHLEWHGCLHHRRCSSWSTVRPIPTWAVELGKSADASAPDRWGHGLPRCVSGLPIPLCSGLVCLCPGATVPSCQYRRCCSGVGTAGRGRSPSQPCVPLRACRRNSRGQTGAPRRCPRIDNSKALTGILFVLKSGIP